MPRQQKKTPKLGRSSKSDILTDILDTKWLSLSVGDFEHVCSRIVYAGYCQGHWVALRMRSKKISEFVAVAIEPRGVSLVWTADDWVV
jgi:hypothetical protein